MKNVQNYIKIIIVLIPILFVILFVGCENMRINEIGEQMARQNNRGYEHLITIKGHHVSTNEFELYKNLIHFYEENGYDEILKEKIELSINQLIIEEGKPSFCLTALEFILANIDMIDFEQRTVQDLFAIGTLLLENIISDEDAYDLLDMTLDFSFGVFIDEESGDIIIGVHCYMCYQTDSEKAKEFHRIWELLG